LHQDFHLGSASAGAFGLAGAAGALAAPLAGRQADRFGPQRVSLVGAVWVTLSFIVMGLGLLLPAAWQLGLIVLGTISFDFGMQVSLVGHQTLVYGIDPAARSRLNAILISGVFLGMASGSALGTQALVRWGWSGVMALCAVAAAAAVTVRLRGMKAGQPR